MRGDAYFAQGNLKAAQTAYEDALAALSPEQYQLKSVIELKLNGAKISTAAATESVVTPVDTAPAEASSAQEGES